MNDLRPISVIDSSDPAEWLAAADTRRRIGRSVEFHRNIGSTNDRAREALATDGEGVAVVADVQTAGRGRQGRSWLSPSGANLMLSVGLRPRLDAVDAWWLSAAAALAVREAAAHISPLGIRWPNDLVSSTGAKVAGLLVETTLDRGRIAEAVIGIGINVNWRRGSMPTEIADRATSLLDLAGHEIDRIDLLSRLLTALDDEVNAVEAGESPLERYRAASALAGQPVRVDLGHRAIEGHALDIDEEGRLLIEHDGEITGVGYGDVIQLQTASDSLV